MSEHTFKVKSEIIKQIVNLFYFSSINIIFLFVVHLVMPTSPFNECFILQGLI